MSAAVDELTGKAATNEASNPTGAGPGAGRRKKLLVAASGTGGHLFPAIATAQQLTDYDIEWLGVPDRLETQLIPDLILFIRCVWGALRAVLA